MWTEAQIKYFHKVIVLNTEMIHTHRERKANWKNFFRRRISPKFWKELDNKLNMCMLQSLDQSNHIYVFANANKSKRNEMIMDWIVIRLMKRKGTYANKFDWNFWEKDRWFYPFFGVWSNKGSVAYSVFFALIFPDIYKLLYTSPTSKWMLFVGSDACLFST